MRWAITGTPGTGKTTATRHLDLDRPIVHLNQLVTDGSFRAGQDEERGTDIADIDGLQSWLTDQPDDLIVESHLAHHLPVDRVIVLRCAPPTLLERLTNRAGEDRSGSKIQENVESERIDVILAEAVAEHGEDRIYEIDTTDQAPRDVAIAIQDAIRGRREPAVGITSFLEEE